MKQIFIFVIGLLLFLSSTAEEPLTSNPIVIENALPGNPYSEWGVPSFREERINGFATKMSLDAGETVHFKIDVENNHSYTLKIYRIGYYGGNGARLMQNLGSLTGVDQPAPVSDPATGLIDCSNWSESASWAIPSTAVSGLYIAKLERTGGGSNHIAFIVRNDASTSDLYLQFPDATWQAYNGYGGSNLYDGTTPGYPSGHALKVSYNRPFFVYNAGFATDGRESDWYMNAEYPMIRWIERNGYDITYTSCSDVATNLSHILNHKVFIAVGHDEYWSKGQRDNVEAARNAGVHMAFFSGNEVYWKTRWESFDGTENRTLVCYKEGTMANGSLDERACGSKCDGSSSEWTGLWRMGGDYDAGKPENALTSQISWTEFPGAIQVPSNYKKIRFWRNTTIPGLSAGQTVTLGANTLGYEWDYEQALFASSNPPGRFTVSSTTISGLTHKLSLYRHSSGALVFGAGTVQWSWGLDGNHWGGSTAVSPEMQQATVNLFADMGVQPATLQPGLVSATQSTDLTTPVSTITSPSNGASFSVGSTITFSGNASDAGGGVVTAIDISVDGGITWSSAAFSNADANISWSYSWTTTATGTFNIKVRGVDDSGNKEIPGAGINVTVNAVTPGACPCTVFQLTDEPDTPLANDESPIELGMKFRSTQNGFITGIRFYKGAGTTGTHTGQLYSNSGTLLASAIFTNEGSSGWQQVLFSNPVAITAGVTYVAAYHSSSGDFPISNSYFTQAIINGPLRALASGEDGPNGVYLYTATPAFPNATSTSNYFVDVVFNTASTLPVTLLNFSATPKENSITLHWTTSSEINNEGFEIQRSINGFNWTAIGFVNGHGNSNSTINYSHVDETLPTGRYYYRLKQVDFDKHFVYSAVVSVRLGGKEDFSLDQNYPNPFRHETIIKFSLPRRSNINLSVFDMNGRLIKQLISGPKEKGGHAVSFNAESLSAGLYYYKLQADDFSEVKKMVVR